LEALLDSSSKEIKRLEDIIQRLRQHGAPDQGHDSHPEQSVDSPDAPRSGIMREELSSMSSGTERMTLLDIASSTMPTEFITSFAVNAYLTHGDPVFHVIPPEYCQDLVNRVYHGSTTPANADICELFAIAAAGCHYSNNIPERESIMSNYIQHSSARLFSGTCDRNLQKMRSYLGLSLCWDPVRSTTARNLICMLRMILFRLY
jgi:hypothetical protein